MLYLLGFSLRLNFFIAHFRSYWGGHVKSVMCAHGLHIFAKLKICSSYGFRETLSGQDKRTDEDCLIDFLIARIKNMCIYFMGSHLSPSSWYIHSAVLFKKKSGLKMVRKFIFREFCSKNIHKFCFTYWSFTYWGQFEF